MNQCEHGILLPHECKDCLYGKSIGLFISDNSNGLLCEVKGIICREPIKHLVLTKDEYRHLCDGHFSEWLKENGDISLNPYVQLRGWLAG